MKKLNSLDVPFFRSKRFIILLHVLACAILFVLPLYLLNYSSVRNASFIQGYYLRTTIYVFLFYINYLWLVPKFLFNGKGKTYGLILILLLAGLFVINEQGHQIIFTKLMNDPNLREAIERLQKKNEIPDIPVRFHLYGFLLTSLLDTGFSIGLHVIDRLRKNEKEKKELEKEKLNSELAFLKNQVSPHFFFNTLNNIYSLVEINTSDAQKAILNLSKLMRYLLYESEHGDIELSKEIEFMKNYVELMKLRLSDKIDLKVDFDQGKNDIFIPPLLFISFIENAFKHGVSYRDKSFIIISLHAEDHKIYFRSINSMGKGIDATSGQGIGLENIQKRLTLLFPRKHNLQITQTDKEFAVNLEIETE